MQLVDSYLNEVARFLSSSQREDVVGELRATIEEEVGEQAASAGRSPTRDDEAAVLARFGHPLKVASGYQARRYLIGPDLFPAYRHTLSTLMVVVLGVQLALALAVAAGSDWSLSLSGLVSQGVESLLWLTAIVTLVFASIEGAGERLRWYDTWEPKALARGSVSVVDRGDVITNLITEGVFLLWWNGALALRAWLPDWSDPGASTTYSLGEAWGPLHWPLNVVFSAFFVLHAFVLVRGLWHRNTLIAESVLGLCTLGAASWLLVAAGPLVTVGGSLEGASLAALQRSVRWALAIAAAFVAWDMVKALRLLRR